ncbi:MAG: PSD1 domain-containing protein [Verrucomicrobia bacterium]|nr:PSD1 domain-containing protein [Verrucomicrobiota bacterium]
MIHSRLRAVQMIFAAALWLCPEDSRGADAAERSGTIRFNRDVRPILSDNCFACHGPDAKKLKGGLRLDLRDLATKPAKSGDIAIVPGKPDESELIARIFAKDEDDLMPPPESHKTLTQAQKELLRRWIAEGAEYEGHWAYLLPVKPAVPGTGNGIDFLVQKRLQELGLEPSPEADRRTLARRLHFDLIGLPPRPEDVEAFERDRSADAYSRLVEKLLTSPHYGERMAIGWLDVVRFADTIGYHSDNPRNIWPYRDYVIKAFNENKPFDQFTREQLAGDLLPGSNQERKVASAFNRLLLSTEEGGAQAKDYETRMLTDRVRAVGTVWLGQTIGCSQCHDHKFDPITSRDFYSMGAFFADIKEPIIGRREDGMLVPDGLQAAELSRLDENLARLQSEFEAPQPAWQAAWEIAALDAIGSETNWSVLAPEKAVSAAGLKLTIDKDHIVSSERDPRDGKDTYRVTVKTILKGVTGFRLEALRSDKLSGHGPGRGAEGNFVLNEFAVEDAMTNTITLSDVTATFEADGFPARAAVDTTNEAKGGWSIRGCTGVNQAIHFSIAQPISADGETTLTFVLKQISGANQVLGRFRLSATTAPGGLKAGKAGLPPPEIAEILKLASENRTDEQKSKLAAYYRTGALELAGLRLRLAEARKAKTSFEGTIPRCLVSVSMEKPRTVRILPRGNWMIETGEIVQPALPAYLTASFKKPDGRGLNRLDLAEWLVSRENPLTARVFVNRLWKQFFGIGLSKVLDDFGAQGEPPVNPALLDWLAGEFMDSGWDVKHIVRLMVGSQTYRQFSTASRELQARDPYNRELARQSRWRLDAELVRDNALAISGLLVPRVGGPSAKPYQPDGYWENLNFPVRSYDASRSADQYRRGLYTWWQRSFVHPSMLAFDAPTREECAAERNRSNIPQQALVLLNDPSYVEAARAFAVRILSECQGDTKARIAWAWRQALARPPRADELELIQTLFGKHLTKYRKDANDAADFLKVGIAPAPSGLDPSELAAWTSVARVLLNLHETITRG